VPGGAALTWPGSRASDAGQASAQVWDILPVVLEKVHWWLPRRRCSSCQKVTTALAPWAQPGSVVYGPGINAAAVLLSSEGNVPVERAAALIGALLGDPGLGRVRRPGAGPARGTPPGRRFR
jgi:transposase